MCVGAVSGLDGRGDRADLLGELHEVELGPELGDAVAVHAEDVHPGSGGRSKCWPLERYVKLVSRLAGRGWNGIVLTGPAEEAVEARVARRAFPRGWSHLASPDLGTAAGLAARCGLYVGNDSGMTHLAAAAGALVLALFLDVHVPAWRPFGRTTVLSGPAIEDVTVERATREIFRLTAFVL